MSTDPDTRAAGDDDSQLAGGEFTDELNDGQVEADAASGSTDGAEDRALDGPENGE
ncbi:hypothetical protein [Microbacterium timonense]|jgi:hypothetical protein|uniref:hypothetical protein n=1 Tax=Microbacterium timonense TaxID=2086576 RepID=UPI00135B80B7|nr:hypothetical protein [Microbacterium timonense]